MIQKMMTINQMFETALIEMYHSEKEVVKIIMDNINTSMDLDVKEVFDEHFSETEEQIRRLERIFDILKIKLKTKTSNVFMGIEKDKKEFMRSKPSEILVDLFNLNIGIKIERLEISGYEMLIMMANVLDFPEFEDLLQENMNKEKDALDNLKSLIRSYDLRNLRIENMGL